MQQREISDALVSFLCHLSSNVKSQTDQLVSTLRYSISKRIYNVYTDIILTTTKLFYVDVSISIRDLRQKKLFSSASGSCHGSDVTHLLCVAFSFSSLILVWTYVFGVAR